MDTVVQLGLVAGGGAVGASARWVAGLLATRLRIAAWVAIMLVNAVGCLAIGLAAGTGVGPGLEAFLLGGVLGGFTTFSTAMLDAWILWRTGRRGAATLCLLGTAAIAMIAVMLGLGVASMVSTGASA